MSPARLKGLRRDEEIRDLVARFHCVSRAQVQAACFAGIASDKRSAQRRLAALCEAGTLRREVAAGVPVYLPHGSRLTEKAQHWQRLCDVWLALRGHVERIELEVRVPGGQADAVAVWQGREVWWEVERGCFDRWDLYEMTGRVLCLWTTPAQARRLVLPAGVTGAVGSFEESPMQLMGRAVASANGGPADALGGLRDGRGGVDNLTVSQGDGAGRTIRSGPRDRDSDRDAAHVRHPGLAGPVGVHPRNVWGGLR